MKKTPRCKCDPCDCDDTMERRINVNNDLENYVWSSNGALKIRAVFKSIIEHIVKKHGGVLTAFDFGSAIMSIEVSPENEHACAVEVQETLDKWGC